MRIGHNNKRNLAYVKKLLIVDDSPAIRHSLRILLENRPDWEVCGEAENGRVGVEKALQLCPDLILLALSMHVMYGFEAARELNSLLPKYRLVMFTPFIGADIVEAAPASSTAFLMA